MRPREHPNSRKASSRAYKATRLQAGCPCAGADVHAGSHPTWVAVHANGQADDAECCIAQRPMQQLLVAGSSALGGPWPCGWAAVLCMLCPELVKPNCEAAPELLNRCQEPRPPGLHIHGRTSAVAAAVTADAAATAIAVTLRVALNGLQRQVRQQQHSKQAAHIKASWAVARKLPAQVGGWKAGHEHEIEKLGTTVSAEEKRPSSPPQTPTSFVGTQAPRAHQSMQYRGPPGWARRLPVCRSLCMRTA